MHEQRTVREHEQVLTLTIYLDTQFVLASVHRIKESFRSPRIDSQHISWHDSAEWSLFVGDHVGGHNNTNGVVETRHLAASTSAAGSCCAAIVSASLLFLYGIRAQQDRKSLKERRKKKSSKFSKYILQLTDGIIFVYIAFVRIKTVQER